MEMYESWGEGMRMYGLKRSTTKENLSQFVHTIAEKLRSKLAVSLSFGKILILILLLLLGHEGGGGGGGGLFPRQPYRMLRLQY